MILGKMFARLAMALGLIGAVSVPFASASTTGEAATMFPGSQVVKTGSQTLPVAVTLQAGGSIATIQVLTQGKANADYTLVSGGTCQGQSYGANQACSVSVQFSPLAPGARLGAVLLFDGNGNLLGTRMLYGIGTGSMGILVPATIETAAGNGSYLYKADGVPAKSASINSPNGVAVDGSGNVYIADTGNNRIRRVDAITGFISTVVGTGTPGASGDNGPAFQAQINGPGQMVIDGAGNLLFADSNNNAIRKLTVATGQVSTLAGQLGQQPAFGGDGGPALSALLSTPEGIALDAAGNLYIADTYNSRVRKVDANTGTISTVAGSVIVPTNAADPVTTGDGGLGTLATLINPWGVATDTLGNLYIADVGSNTIRLLTAGGYISTFAGNGRPTYDGDTRPATQASLKGPASVGVDVAGNLYIADSGNHRVRKVAFDTKLITTIAGNGADIAAGDGGPANQAALDVPYALAFASNGDLYVATVFDHFIRVLQNSIADLHYDPIKVGRLSASQAVTIEDDGNAVLTFTALTPDSNSALDPATTTCAVATPLVINQQCVIGAVFAPLVTGSEVMAQIQAQSDAANSPAVVNLTGESDALEPTVTLLTSSTNPAALGSAVTFTATVSGGGTAPMGNIKFYDGTTLLGTTSTGSGSTATFVTSSLVLGAHNITANFTGDTTNSPSTSAILTEIIKQTPTVMLASSANPSQVGVSVQFTATVMGPNVAPGGSVVFIDGGTPIGNGTLNGIGIATFSTTALTAGTHPITASYSGDTYTLPLNSAALSQTVRKWATTTTVTSSSPNAPVGTNVVFSMHVSTTSSVAPAGTVLLIDGNGTIATLTIDGSGNASYSTTSLTQGVHTISASFQGDTTNEASASASITENIQQIATTTVLTTSANPASAGATLRLTATVTPASTNSAAGTLSGNVTFMDGAATIGQGSVSAAGIATLDVSTLAVGTHTIVAVYPGTTNYGASTSNSIGEVVQLAGTQVTLNASNNPTIAGKGITLTAVVSGSGGVPTGTVIFHNGSTVLGTVTVGGSGQANLNVSNLPTGSQSLTATYSGDAKDNAGTSNVLVEVVQQAQTAINLVSSANPSFAGANVTFTASLTSNGGLPAGSITLSENGNILQTSAISGTGVATFNISTLVAGSHTLIASFAGDADHAASSAPGLIQVVQTGTSTVALSSSANPSVFGDTLSFGIRVTGTALQPTGTVTLMDQGTALTTLTLNGQGVASFSTAALTIGDHPLTAVYSGDTTHAGSTSSVLTQRVRQATTTTSVSSENPSVVGDNVKFTATIVGAKGAPINGTVSFSDGVSVLGSATVSNGTASFSTSTLVAGTHLIAATYSGDATNVNSVSGPLSQTVNTAGTTVTISSSANPSVTGTAVTFSATVASSGEAASGSVSFMDGSAQLGTGKVTNGVATFTTSSLTAGQHAIVARYGGDAGTQVSTSSALLQVVQNKTGISLISSVNPALTLQGIVLTATVSNGAHATGVVTFTDGGTQLGSLTLDANGTAVLTLASLPAGSHALVASYSGDNYNLPSASTGVTEVVQLRASQTSMTASSDTYLSGQQITLVGVVHADGPVAPTGTVTFTAGTTTFGSAPVSASGAATLPVFPIESSYDIVATYSGDAVYAASTADKFTIKAGASTTFTMQANPTTLSMASGTHTTIDLTIASVKGFTDTIALGCLGLPADATCTFSSDKSMLTANGTNVVHLTIDTGNPLGIGAIAQDRRTSLFGDVSKTTRAGFVLPAAFFVALLIGWARRKTTMSKLLTLFVLAGMGLSLTSCANSLSQTTTPAGSYTIRVVASGTQSGASQITDLSVTVTK